MACQKGQGAACLLVGHLQHLQTHIQSVPWPVGSASTCQVQSILTQSPMSIALHPPPPPPSLPFHHTHANAVQKTVLAH